MKCPSCQKEKHSRHVAEYVDVSIIRVCRCECRDLKYAERKRLDK